MALGANSGLGTLTLPVKRRGGLGFGLAHLGTLGNRWDAIAQELVALTTLDAVVAVRGLDRLDFIKADIEGGNCVRCMAVRTPCDGLGRA
jgi:hypothetical protein